MADEDHQIKAAEEQAVFGKRREVTGTVRVDIVTRTADQTVEGTLHSEDVDIRHVPVEHWVDGPVPPRQDGDTTIISLVEEVAVVERRLRVFEEIHLTRKSTTRTVQQQVPVRRQEAVIDRTTTAANPPER